MLMRRLVLPMGGGLLLGGILLWLAVFRLPPALYPPLPPSERSPQVTVEQETDRLRLQNEARGTLLDALGGAVLLLGVAFTLLQLRATREGQITDRYTKAVDQLGNQELAARLGGIYALQRIARDSRGDRVTIAEVLCAYARSAERTPRTEKDLESHTLDRRAPDVQAALTILAKWRRRVGGELEWRDLHGGDFQDARLEDAYLPNAYFYDAQLQRAKLERATLVQANLFRSHLQNADFRGADLTGADLRRSDLSGSDLMGANLNGAMLQNAKADEHTIWPESWRNPTARREAGIVEVEHSLESTSADSRDDPHPPSRRRSHIYALAKGLKAFPRAVVNRLANMR